MAKDQARRTAEDWRAFVAALDQRLARLRARVDHLKREGLLLEAVRLLARRDLIDEHLDRALDEAARLTADRDEVAKNSMKTTV